MNRNDELRQADQIAKENAVQTSNGNRFEPSPSKSGGAERGGPGVEAAHDRQPPDSTRTGGPVHAENASAVSTTTPPPINNMDSPDRSRFMGPSPSEGPHNEELQSVDNKEARQ